MQRSAYITFGAAFGIALTLFIFVLANQDRNLLLAQTVDKSGGGDIIVATGGTASQLFDVLWVIKKSAEDTYLACYKVTAGGMKIQLVAARKIDYDLKITDWNSLPDISEIADKVRKAEKERDKIKQKEDKEKLKEKGTETGGAEKDK